MTQLDFRSFSHMASKPWISEAMRALAASPSGAITLSPSCKRDSGLFSSGEVGLLAARSLLTQLASIGAIRFTFQKNTFGNGTRIELLDIETLSAIFKWSAKPTPVETLRDALSSFGVPADLAASAATSCKSSSIEPERLASALISASCSSLGGNHSIRRFSAEHFFGDSKFLDSKDALRIALGIEDSASQPILLNLHLPAQFNRILWIENLDTYYYFIIEQDNGHPLLTGQALAYAQGFKGASPRLREPRHRILAFSGMAHLACDAATLVDDAQTPMCFFGDADFSGLAILASLRKIYPNASGWKPGYDFLAQLLAQGHGHNAEQAGKSGQSEPPFTGCPYADATIRSALTSSGRMIDQESYRLPSTPPSSTIPG